mgnify:CR=1 FL=1
MSKSKEIQKVSVEKVTPEDITEKIKRVLTGLENLWHDLLLIPDMGEIESMCRKTIKTMEEDLTLEAIQNKRYNPSQIGEQFLKLTILKKLAAELLKFNPEGLLTILQNGVDTSYGTTGTEQ